jgi:hypothetical protein
MDEYNAETENKVSKEKLKENLMNGKRLQGQK